MSNGVVTYRGPSMLDGKPIICVITGLKVKSANTKTGGELLQSWILREDIDPRLANKIGEDYSICGNCKLRGKPIPIDDPRKLAEERPCYVNIYQAPLNVWNSYHKGNYEVLQGHSSLVDVGRGRKIRIGSYGDGSAVPSWHWDSLLQESKGRTGYTHQHTISSAHTRYDLCMKSADTLEEAEDAWAKGVRTFRVVNSIQDVIKAKEILCPASEEMGRLTTCDNCMLCSGSGIKAKSIAIVGHGNGAKYIAA